MNISALCIPHGSPGAGGGRDPPGTHGAGGQPGVGPGSGLTPPGPCPGSTLTAPGGAVLTSIVGDSCLCIEIAPFCALHIALALRDLLIC